MQPLFCFLALPVTGGFKLEPVSRLYLARPLAVSPAPLLAGRFSPLPTLRFGPFLRFFLFGHYFLVPIYDAYVDSLSSLNRFFRA